MVILLFAVLATAVFAEKYEIRYYAPKAQKVFIAGDFNGWNPQDTEMNSAGGGWFSKKLELTPGVHEYKVIIDGEWLEGGNLKYNTVLRKTLVTSNFTWSPKVFWKGRFLVNSSSVTESCFSAEGDITLNKNVTGMFALSSHVLDGSRRNRMDKSFIAFDKNGFLLKSFYNVRMLQSNDPMRLLRADYVPLRQQETLFTSETNPRENYGLNKQGIYVSYGPAQFFFDDDYNTEEDLIYAHCGLKGINAQYLSRRGVDFPFANEWHWFPDPGQTPTWQGNQSVQPWYNGYEQENKVSIYGIVKKGQAEYFGQWSGADSLLRAEYWNEGGGGYAPSGKEWRYWESNSYMAGARYGRPLGVEASYFLEDGKLKEFWNYKTRTRIERVVLKWEKDKSYLAASALFRRSRRIEGYDVYRDFDPYYIRYYFDTGGRFYRWKEYDIDGMLKGGRASLKFNGKIYPEVRMKQAVATAEFSIAFLKAAFSPYYMVLGSDGWFTYSASLSASKGPLTLSAGYGMTPGSLLLWDENDRREDILYNSPGMNSGWNTLKEAERIWLRAELKF